MCAQAHTSSLGAAINRVLPPGAVVETIRPLPSTRVQRFFEATISDGTVYTISIAPHSMVRLLRSEQSAISSEAVLLKWIVQDKGAEHGDQSPSRSHGVHELTPYLPTLVAHSSASPDLPADHNIIHPLPGQTVSQLSPPLTPHERESVDYQSGSLLRRAASVQSPTGKFGPALDVLPRTGVQQSKRSSTVSWIEPKETAFDSWSLAFGSLLEGILRDAEDLAIMLPYSTIRSTTKKYSPLLDRVARSCLVVVDGGQDCNILVQRKTVSTTRESSLSRAAGQGTDDDDTGSASKEDLDKPRTPDSRSRQPPIVDRVGGDAEIVVTGMQDWSSCVFGDPLFAAIFSQDPTHQFMRGFAGYPVEETKAKPRLPKFIDDRTNADVRILLYGCYHALVRVVRELCRPQRDSSRRELAAREELKVFLSRLSAIQGSVEAQKTSEQGRSRRPSGEMSPAKRPKTDDEESDAEAETKAHEIRQ